MPLHKSLSFLLALLCSAFLSPVFASDARIDAVFLAQTHVSKPDHPYFKLTGNRPALLKVHVVSPTGASAPAVAAIFRVGGTQETLTLSGPSVLPRSLPSEPGKVQHRFSDSFTVMVPARLIKPGLNIVVRAGNSQVSHDINVGAPTAVKMKMFDVHYFGLGNADYPAGWQEELEAKWPVVDLQVERIRGLNFPELVVPARPDVGTPHVRVSSRDEYQVKTGQRFDGEQAAALEWVHALSASGGNQDVAMCYVNIIGVPAGGQAGGFDGVGAVTPGILHHELGHALSLPHWGTTPSYPYRGDMYGIPAAEPDIVHVGPTWAFDLPSRTFIPPTVQIPDGRNPQGTYKADPMWGGGVGDQEPQFIYRHFSDYSVFKMLNYLESKVAVPRGGEHYKWNANDAAYTTRVNSDGVRYPIAHDVRVISVMASLTLSDRDVNMVYPPIGPYTGNLIETFDPGVAGDRASAARKFCPAGGCDFSLRLVQGDKQKVLMLPASGVEGSDPYARGSLKTAAVNLRASEGNVTKVELLLTPDAERNGLPGNPEVLYVWEDEDTDPGTTGDGDNQYEAEEHTALSGVTIRADNPGYTGTGYGDFGGSGTWLEWDNVKVTLGGTRTLHFRYASGSTPRPSALYINGAEVARLEFAPTGGWSQWETESVDVRLKAGANSVRVLALNNGGTNLDHMKVGGAIGYVLMVLVLLAARRYRRIPVSG